MNTHDVVGAGFVLILLTIPLCIIGGILLDGKQWRVVGMCMLGLAAIILAPIIVKLWLIVVF